MLEAGDGTITWAEWCAQNIVLADGTPRSMDEIQRQIGWAKCGDVVAKIEKRRTQVREAVARHDAKTKSGLANPEIPPPPAPNPRDTIIDRWTADAKFLLKDGCSPDELRAGFDEIAGPARRTLCTTVDGVIPFSTDAPPAPAPETDDADPEEQYESANWRMDMGVTWRRGSVADQARFLREHAEGVAA